MAVEIEDKHIKICNDISKEINKGIKKRDAKNYEKLLNTKNLSIEKKKKKLVLSLRSLMVQIFAAGIKKKNKKAYLNDLKRDILLLIGLVTKLNRMNYYIQSVFLHEIGIAKNKPQKGIKDYEAERAKKEPSYLSKEELAKIENAVCRLIEKIIFIDKNLLKKYKKREEKIAKKEELDIKDIKKIIGRESELLDHIEAKLPPPKKLKQKLLEGKNFNHWMLTTLALLSAFENEYRKELLIFDKLKKDQKIRKKIDTKISGLVKEKESLFRIKERKMKSIADVNSMEKEFKEALHNFASASSL